MKLADAYSTRTIVLGCLFVSAIVAGAPVDANEEHFSELLYDTEEKIGLDHVMFVDALKDKLFYDCDNKDAKSFASNIEDKNSEAHKCVVNSLGNSDILVETLQFAPMDEMENSNDFLDKGQKNSREIVVKAKDSCRKFVDGIEVFFDEAKGTDYATSRGYAYRLIARNVCQVLLQSDF